MGLFSRERQRKGSGHASASSQSSQSLPQSARRARARETQGRGGESRGDCDEENDSDDAASYDSLSDGVHDSLFSPRGRPLWLLRRGAEVQATSAGPVIPVPSNVPAALQQSPPEPQEGQEGLFGRFMRLVHPDFDNKHSNTVPVPLSTTAPAQAQATAANEPRGLRATAVVRFTLNDERLRTSWTNKRAKVPPVPSEQDLKSALTTLELNLSIHQTNELEQACLMVHSRVHDGRQPAGVVVLDLDHMLLLLPLARRHEAKPWGLDAPLPALLSAGQRLFGLIKSVDELKAKLPKPAFVANPNPVPLLHLFVSQECSREPHL